MEFDKSGLEDARKNLPINGCLAGHKEAAAVIEAYCKSANVTLVPNKPSQAFITAVKKEILWATRSQICRAHQAIIREAQNNFLPEPQEDV